jgi:hypothetical protein
LFKQFRELSGTRVYNFLESSTAIKKWWFESPKQDNKFSVTLISVKLWNATKADGSLILWVADKFFPTKSYTVCETVYRVSKN